MSSIQVVDAPPHPAKFSDEILPVIASLLRQGSKVLDPFAGVGRVHELPLFVSPASFETWGVEIEPEWSMIHPRNLVGDAHFLPFRDNSFDAVACSPVYGNRMSDAHNARERCKPCKGSGVIDLHASEQTCSKCGGEGRRFYKRLTYTHQIGRKLHPNNSGQLQWGERYREFHRLSWREVHRVTRDQFVLNVSNHIRNHVEIDVAGWHLKTVKEVGFDLVTSIPVKTKRMGFGANSDARVEHEIVALFRKIV